MKRTTKNILISCMAVLSLGAFTACSNTGEDSITANTASEISDTSVTTNSETASAASEVSSAESSDTESAASEAAESNAPQAAVLDENMPDPFLTGIDMGGDENAAFYQPCNRILDNIPVELMNLRDETEVNNWINSFPSISQAPSSITDYANIYSFVTAFDISKEEAETALSFYLNSDDEQIKITREDFDTLFSGDIEAITKTFASEYSVAVGQYVYCPNWIYTHSAENYISAGITAEAVAEKADSYSDFNLTEEARTAFSDKLSAFTGEAISIEPVQIYADFDDNAAENDIAEDIMEDVSDNEIVADEVVDETK